jgi:hypothetical protein
VAVISALSAAATPLTIGGTGTTGIGVTVRTPST